MKPEDKRQIYGVIQTAVISAVLSAIFMYFFYYRGWQSIGAGICIGFCVPVSLAFYTRFIFNRYLQKINLLLVLLINTLAHLIVILIIAILFVGIFYMHGDFQTLFSRPDFIFSRFFLIGIIFGLILSLIFNFFSILNTLIGRHILAKLFIGLYRQPREIERVFMFLDIKSSTTIAEKIGHLKFMSLVNDFFYDIAEPVHQTKGEIYKYVGDEAIITWKMEHAIANGNCVHCFLQIQQAIKAKSDHYIQHYGIVPEFKAGLHGGFSVTGELGYTKREIAYMGDVLNTAARIEGACNTFQESILISELLVNQIEYNSNLLFRKVGSVKLRGKLNEVILYGLAEKKQIA